MPTISDMLPRSLFGVPMPWAQPEPLNPVPQHEIAPTEEPLHTETSTLDPKDNEKPTNEPSKSEAVPAISQKLPEIEEGLKLLAVEQGLRLKKKAEGLHAEVKAKHATVKLIDELMGLIASRAQQNADGTPNAAGTIDCSEPTIVNLTATLRKEGISVPLPSGNLVAAERGNAVSVLVNQRGLVSDELREKAQEFQQCVTEQNSFFQMLMAIADTWNRIISKWIGLIHPRGA